MADAYKRGHLAHASAEVRKLSDSMSLAKIREFAATKGLAAGGIPGMHHAPAFHLEAPGTVKMTGAGGAGGMGGGGGKAISPSQASPWWERSEARGMAGGAHTGFYTGGDVGMGTRAHFDSGGQPSFGQDNPWWERSEARQADIPFHGGLIDSSIAGRTDRLPLAVGTEAHVAPADVVSGVGQGNTLAGARILTLASRIGPWGTALPREDHGHTIPRPPSEQATMMARGGYPGRVGILAAGGEFVWPPENWVARDPEDGKLYLHRGVRSFGNGDFKKGHATIDDMIKRVRDHTKKFLKNAPPPKK
jgi:hypothetical protein